MVTTSALPPVPTTGAWLETEDLASRWKVPVETIRKWRTRGTGPKGVKFGRHVRYALEEVERWELEQAAKSA